MSTTLDMKSVNYTYLQLMFSNEEIESLSLEIKAISQRQMVISFSTAPVEKSVRRQ